MAYKIVYKEISVDITKMREERNKKERKERNKRKKKEKRKERNEGTRKGRRIVQLF
jgi:hypothetical protein